MHPERNPLLRWLRRVVPLTSDYKGQRFLVRASTLPDAERPARPKPLLGIWVGTPLLAVLVAVETTDLIFAIDSIPAIFAITTDTFIVFTSNAFALLGLRALYFMLAGAMHRFVYLKVGLALILVFVGVKFLLSDIVGKMAIWISLPFIATVIGVSIAASLLATRGASGPEDGPGVGAEDDRSEERESTAGAPVGR